MTKIPTTKTINKIIQCLQSIEDSTSLFLIGADEVGYGSCAGPLFVCGFKAPKNWYLNGLNDSKELTPKVRYELRDELLLQVGQGKIAYYIAKRSNIEIDQYGLGPMTQARSPTPAATASTAPAT